LYKKGSAILVEFWVFRPKKEKNWFFHNHSLKEDPVFLANPLWSRPAAVPGEIPQMMTKRGKFTQI